MKKREDVMKALTGFTTTVKSLTSVVIALLGLGIVVSLLGGKCSIRRRDCAQYSGFSPRTW
jgi:ABC-type phosphate transport system permease subunit